VVRALKAFGAPLDEISDNDFARPGTGFMMGLPPNRNKRAAARDQDLVDASVLERISRRAPK